MKTSAFVLASTFALASIADAAQTQIDRSASQRFTSPTPGAGDLFGRVLAMDGDTLAVGAPGAGSGTVTLYSIVGGTWQFDAQLAVSGLDPDARFGAAVALQGDRLVVGAPVERFGTAHSRGAAFVFERNAGVWGAPVQLASGLSDVGQAFGTSVALDGDRVVVGAPAAAAVPLIQSGVVCVFDWNAGVWTGAAVLGPSDAWQGFEFGASVGVKANEVVVGAPSRQPLGASSREGAVYVYSLGATGWQEDQILVDSLAPTNTRLTRLGRTLAFDGQTIASGASETQLDFIGSQGALVFERSVAGWAALQRLTSSLASDFGTSVALDEGRLVVGARNSGWTSNGSPVGVATLWRRESTGWSERWRLLDSPPVSYARFGAAAAISNGRIAIGSPDAPWNSETAAGAVSTLELPSTVGELLCFGDGSGTACPCGLSATASHGPGCQNSLGHGAVLLGSGSTSVAADDLALTAAQLVPGKTAMLAYRAAAANSGDGIPLYNGLLCVSGPGGRLGVRTATIWPWTATWDAHVATQVGATAGATTYFQVWYRDPTGACGGGSNLTNALKVTFSP